MNWKSHWQASLLVTDRRGFLKRCLALVHGFLGGFVAFAGLRFLLDPLRRTGRPRAGQLAGGWGRDGRYIRVAPLSALASHRPTGLPAAGDKGGSVRVAVLADRWDAFTHYPPGPIGSVWLLPTVNERGEPTVRCLQTICPHLGCAIDYRSDREIFSCPCHASDFDRTGKRLTGPSPRDMDELNCRITEADGQGRRWIEISYQEFETGAGVKRPLD